VNSSSTKAAVSPGGSLETKDIIGICVGIISALCGPVGVWECIKKHRVDQGALAGLNSPAQTPAASASRPVIVINNRSGY
jgi:hypothetical protein